VILGASFPYPTAARVSKLFDSIASHLSYDNRINLWRADTELALKDMKRAKRPMELVNEEEL
jgi:hypothetical protein